jgi:hypothetical protein
MLKFHLVLARDLPGAGAAQRVAAVPRVAVKGRKQQILVCVVGQRGHEVGAGLVRLGNDVHNMAIVVVWIAEGPHFGQGGVSNLLKIVAILSIVPVLKDLIEPVHEFQKGSMDLGGIIVVFLKELPFGQVMFMIVLFQEDPPPSVRYARSKTTTCLRFHDGCSRLLVFQSSRESHAESDHVPAPGESGFHRRT